MSQAPVLKLPNFNEPFVVETDASGIGIGAILQQGGHPIAYMSKALSPKHHNLSTYEKEFLAVIQALKKLRGYLLDRHFVIKTDHFSLKYLMDQRLNTPTQRKWLPNLMSTVSSKLYERIKEGWTKDNELQAIIHKLQQGSASSKHYSWTANQLLGKGKLVIGKDNDLRQALLRHFHSEDRGGNSVAQAFLNNIYRVHGLPKVIVSDKDTVFLSRFWKELFHKLQVSLHMSSAYHPQTDGQAEVVNISVECYLRCMCGDKPKEWANWIALAEYWYNTSYHTAINNTPFHVVFGQPPPAHITYNQGESPLETVERSLVTREAAIDL
ncbi:reverse transcriptase [Tanacetum coccineum]